MNVSTTSICPVISRLYISDMFAATIPNALQICPKRFERLYVVKLYLNTDFRWTRLTLDTTINIHRNIVAFFE